MITTAACFGLMLASPPAGVSAHASVPYSVRVGLYYNSSAGDSAAQSSYRIYCEDGISLGCADGGGGEYKHLYDFNFADGSEKMNLSQYTFGKAYAVTMGGGAATIFDVAGRVKDLRQAGYDPQLAYFNGWVLIAGFYDTQGAAMQAVESNLSGAFPEYDFSVNELSGKYIAVTTGDIRHFIFDANNENLRAAPTTAKNGENAALIELNGKRQRGVIEFIREAKSGITAVNILRMDEYLYGVVPSEIQASSSHEALKAQAVAARTYTVNFLGKHGAAGFDLCAGTHCQVYGGIASEDARSSLAVDETSGKIVTYNGNPAQVFYFSSSGGYTANVKYVWSSEQEYPYLAGVEDKYESGLSHNYTWETVYTANEIKAKLAAGGTDIGDINGVAVTKTAEGGRAIEVTITGSRGTKVYSNGDCRTFLNNLHSQVYTVFAVNSGDTASGGKTLTAIGSQGTSAFVSGSGEAVGAGGQISKLKGNGGTVISDSGYSNIPAGGTTFRFAGRGWGHGVGMSQEGAKGMANAGFSYIEILIHYFPGCAVG